MLTVKALRDYLAKFSDDAGVKLVVADPPRREIRQISGSLMLNDFDFAAFGIELGEAIPFDETMMKAAAEDEEAQGDDD